MRIRIIGQWLCAAWICLSWSTSLTASEARNTPEVRAVNRSLTAVVNIHSEKTSVERDRDHKIKGMGTGIIVDERGYIVTNQHVVADVESLRVTLHDNSSYLARVISFDRKHDLAVIKIDASRKLAVIPLGTSSDVMLAEKVIAIGNAFGYEHTVTVGHVSALSRDVEVNETQSYKNLIQTDAAINPGNSGGPLINLDGEVIGINVAIRANAQKIGFAIPIDDARRFIAHLLDTARLNDTYHGLVSHDVKAAAHMQLIVDTAEPNSPAALAGFRAGDVVMQAGPVTVRDQADFERAFLERPAGDLVDVVVKREAETVTLKMQLAQVPGKPESVDSKCWRILGLKLAKAPATDLKKFGYNGGMHVVDVRPDSPAFRDGIRRGDVLIGLISYETCNLDNMLWIINNIEQNSHDLLQFVVMRQQQRTEGHLRLALQRK